MDEKLADTKQSRLGTVLAVIGGLVGLVSGALHVANYLAERPRVSPFVDRVQLAGENEGRDISTQLAEIEQKFGESTGVAINKLRGQALAVNFEKDPDALQAFSKDVQQAIQQFDREVIPPTVDNVRYETGTLVFPDGNRINLLDTEFPAVLLPGRALDSVRKNPSTPDANDVQQLKIAAIDLIGNVDETGNRRQIAEGLRRIRIQLSDILAKRNRRISVELLVKNESRMPNVIMEQALIRIHNSKDAVVDVPLHVTQSQVLPGYSATRLVLESERVSTLDEKTRDFVMNAFAKEYKYMVVVSDLQGEPRSCEGLLTETGGPTSKIKALVQYADTQLRNSA